MSDTNRTAVRYAKEPSFGAPIGGANATGTVTFAGAAADGDTVTINGQAYTFETAALDTAYKVAAGTTSAASASNLADAINAFFNNLGVTYAVGTAAHPTVVAVANSNVVTITARAHGTGGNSITLAEVGANITVSGANLTGGAASNYASVKELRYVRHSLRNTKVTVESEEIRSDRTSSGLIKVGIGAGGEFVGEASWGDYNDFRCSAVQQPLVSGSDTSTSWAISVGVLSNGGALPANLRGARYIKMSGWANAQNNGIKKVIASDANSITFDLGTVTNEGAGPSVTVAWAYSRQGGGSGVTLESYVIDTEFTDAATVIPLTGMCVNTWSLSLQPRSKIMETFTFVGFGLPSGTTARTDTVGNAVVAPSTNPIINTTSHIAQLQQGGLSPRTFVQSLDFTLNNNLRERLALSREGTLPCGSGQSAPGGTIVSYFDDREEYNAFLAHTQTSLEFRMQDSAGRIINVYMPVIQFGDGGSDVPGINQDVMLNRTFKAERGVGHDGTEFQFQIDLLQP